MLGLFSAMPWLSYYLCHRYLRDENGKTTRTSHLCYGGGTVVVTAALLWKTSWTREFDIRRTRDVKPFHAFFVLDFLRRIRQLPKNRIPSSYYQNALIFLRWLRLQFTIYPALNDRYRCPFSVYQPKRFSSVKAVSVLLADHNESGAEVFIIWRCTSTSDNFYRLPNVSLKTVTTF